MHIGKRRWTAHRAWSWIAAAAVVAMMLAVFAAPISAAANKTHLSAATVSPRTGTPKTVVVVTVVYQNERKSPAQSVTLHIGDQDHAMARVAGGDWRTGVTFRWSGKVKVGTFNIQMSTLASDHGQATLGAGTVKITAPKPKPTATPKPAADTTPRSTSKPARTAPRVATKPRPIAPVGAAILAAMRPGPSNPPITVAIITDGRPGGPGPGGSGSDVPIIPGGGPVGPGKVTAWGPIASVLAMVGLTGPTFPAMALAPTLVTTTGAVATAMAFGLFGRRRRDDDEIPDEMLAVAAATGVGVAPNQMVGMSPVATEERIMPPAEAYQDEALLPRWRRPSLLQARKADPVRDSKPAARLTFGEGLVGPMAGHERRVIRYRVVRLLDTPDELRGTEIGYLDQGDEVQLLEKYGAYWLVLSPDGQQGWLHKMVLGEIVDDDGPSQDVPVATMPTVADSWTMGEADIDSDVFEAYLEARRRAS